MTPASFPDLDRLEALARAAPPGPWEIRWAWGDETRARGEIIAIRRQGGDALDGFVASGWCVKESTGRYLAAADPQTVLALLAELREARRRCESLAERVAAQSDLLSRRAERPAPGSAG